MSRVVELIKRFVADTGQSETSVKSLRLSNDPRGVNTLTTVRMIVSFTNEVIDQIFLNSIVGTGIYLDDTFLALQPDGKSIKIDDISKLNNEKFFKEIEIGFSYEKKPITSEQIIKKLQAETIFGLPHVLFKNVPISNLKIYFGVNQSALQLLKESALQARAYKTHPFLSELTKVPIVEFLYIDDRSNLTTLKRPITDYIDEDLILLLTRHAYTPKVGLKICSIFPSNFFSNTVPLATWDFIRQQVSNIVREDLNRHTKSQVDRISKRIGEVQRRKKIISGGIDFGLAPINEVETVLLFQKLALMYPNKLPGGLRVELIDYSPKDIDSICRFQLSPNHPAETGPVEFEFSLASFFKHGHDYRQVKLIICYTIKPLVFPYFYGGINYSLDKSGIMPKLTNTLDNSSVPCLILEELFK